VVERNGPGADPVAAREKGGDTWGADLGAEVPDQGLHGGGREAELGGDVGLRTFVEKESPEHFIAAVQDLGWLEEEASAGGIVHGRSPASRVIFAQKAAERGKPKRRPRQEGGREIRGKPGVPSVPIKKCANRRDCLRDDRSGRIHPGESEDQPANLREYVGSRLRNQGDFFIRGGRRYIDVGEIFERGLLAFLDGIQTTCRRVGDEIQHTFFLT
jgi:hypothetical protein